MASKAKGLPEKPVSGIRAIADALGVSMATVDRALHRRGRISERTRLRVLEMAEVMGYTPNLAARHLRLNRRFSISVNLPLPLTFASFFTSLRSGIEEGALPFRSALDINFNSYSRTTEEQEQVSFRAALDAQVSGIITCPANTLQMADLVREAKQKAIPVICVATDVPESGRLTAITAHPFTCGAMAAEMLASCMGKWGSVAVLTGDFEHFNHTEKVRGFQSVISRAPGMHRLAAVIDAHDDFSEAYRRIRKLLQDFPKLSGLYISTGNSIPALEALRDAGKLGAVSVVSTDFFPELVPFIRDGAVRATIYQCPEIQGSIAIRTMYRYLSEAVTPPPAIGVTPQLIIKSNVDLYVENLNATVSVARYA
ncbi:MAG: substrate-binding domain-containing protein [Acidobacteriaceae bacterium]